MELWSVNFKDYLNFRGVKEGIEEMKAIRKEEKGMEHCLVGAQVEKVITDIISSHPDFHVKPTALQMDIGFGADLQVSYQQGRKTYGFFVDITSTRKSNVQYLTLRGSTTPEIKEALCYETEYFKIRFGLKETHASWFFYEKPVVVLYVEHFTPCEHLSMCHLNNIMQIIIGLNNLLVDMGYSHKASRMIRPNINRYRFDYCKELAMVQDTPESWGSFIYHSIK